MKKPKLTHLRRPALFYQDGSGRQKCGNGPRLRILFPNGNIMWSAYYSSWSLNFCNVCFDNAKFSKDQYENHYSIFPTAKAAFSAMRDFDKRNGFSNADFLGYL